MPPRRAATRPPDGPRPRPRRLIGPEVALYFALFYDYVPDVLEKRAPFRPEHLALAQAEQAAGRLVMAGAFDPPTDGALFVFRAEGAAEVEDFVRRDPYVKNGVVSRWRVKPWTVVVGG